MAELIPAIVPIHGLTQIQLSRTYNRFLDTTAGHHVKSQKNWVPASNDKGRWTRTKCQRYSSLILVV